jgi:hypothetical protein
VYLLLEFVNPLNAGYAQFLNVPTDGVLVTVGVGVIFFGIDGVGVGVWLVGVHVCVTFGVCVCDIVGVGDGYGVGVINLIASFCGAGGIC